MPYLDHEEFPDFDQDDDPGVTCLRCGEEELHWERVTSPDGRSEKPVLFDADMRRHVCKPSANDFEVLA